MLLRYYKINIRLNYSNSRAKGSVNAKMDKPEITPEIKCVKLFGITFQFAVYPDAAIEEMERKSNSNSNCNIEVVNSHKNPRVGGPDPLYRGRGQCRHAQGSLPHGCLSTFQRYNKYYIYILDCEPAGTGNIYVGQTENISDRLWQHIIGMGAKFTRKNKPCDLLHLEIRRNRRDSLKREQELIKNIKSGIHIKTDIPLEFFGFFIELLKETKKYKCVCLDDIRRHHLTIPFVPEWD